MITLRDLNSPADMAGLLALDTSFHADRILRTEWNGGRAITLIEVLAAAAIRKTYPLAQQLDELPLLDWVQVATQGEAIVGLAALRIAEWNRRAELHHLYVGVGARGRGVGRMLVEAAADAARRLDARLLWVETQTINFGAVRFYERLGFVLCGIDASLYDPADSAPDEVALFFARDLTSDGETR